MIRHARSLRGNFISVNPRSSAVLFHGVFTPFVSSRAKANISDTAHFENELSA
jgi:hypothetical protein